MNTRLKAICELLKCGLLIILVLGAVLIYPTIKYLQFREVQKATGYGVIKTIILWDKLRIYKWTQKIKKLAHIQYMIALHGALKFGITKKIAPLKLVVFVEE